MCRKRPELLPNNWILHHDNAPAHKAISFKQFLAQKPITEIERHSFFFFPDLAPNDLQLFPSAVKGQIFQDSEDIQKYVATALKSVPQ
jgi:hypothetical protein